MEVSALVVKVHDLSSKLPPVRWNEREVEANLDQMLAAYTGRVYTADEIKSAKGDRAAVNAIEKQLAAAEKTVKELYAAPVQDFTRKIRQFRDKCSEVSGAIDAQVKAVEEAQKAEKRQQLVEVYQQEAGEDLALLVPFAKVFDQRWLNKTYAFTAAEKELRTRLETCRAELERLRGLCEPGEEYMVCERAYLVRLSISDALKERQDLIDHRERAQRAEAARELALQQAAAMRAASPIIPQPSAEELAIKAEAAQRAADSTIITPDGRLDFSSLQAAPTRKEEKFSQVDFRVFNVTRDDLAAIKKLLAERGIRYGKVK